MNRYLPARPAANRGFTFVLILLAAFLQSSCATTATQSAGSEQPVEKVEYPLTDDLLFELLAAEFAGNTGELDLSVKYYLQAMEDTEDDRVAARSAYIALYAERYDEVLQSLQRWQELAPDADEINRVYAVTYLKLGKNKLAASYLYKQLSNSEADDREQVRAVKTLLQKESDTPNSREVLKELNILLGSNVYMQILEARYAAQLEEYDAALVLLDKVLLADPSLADVHIIKSRILAAQGKRKESMEIVRTVLADHPDNYNLRLNYARLLVDEKKFKEAREQFLILLKENPDNADTLLSLALLSIETKQLAESQVYLEKLIALDKKVDIANYYLGRIAQNDKKSKIAIAYFLKVKHGDYVFDAKLRIAGLFAKLGRGLEGLRQLEILAEKQTAWPNRVRVYLAQGEILRDLAKHEEAVEMYSRALQQNPDDPDLLYARALAAEKVDRLDITETDLLRVLSSEPENANALNALGYTLADKTERLEDALKYIQRAAELVPDDAAILDSLGWVSYRLGKMQDALKWLQIAFEKLEDAEIAAHYGEVLWMNDRKQEARQVWDKGIASNAKHPVLVETLKRLLK